jgi:hypothetical protein
MGVAAHVLFVAVRDDFMRSKFLVHMAILAGVIRHQVRALVGAVNMLVDITDRKRAEEAVRAMVRRSTYDRHGGYREDDDFAYGWEDFEPTRGTVQTTLEILGGKAVEWRKLQWLPAERPLGLAGRAAVGFGGSASRTGSLCASRSPVSAIFREYSPAALTMRRRSFVMMLTFLMPRLTKKPADAPGGTSVFGEPPGESAPWVLSTETC